EGGLRCRRGGRQFRGGCDKETKSSSERATSELGCSSSGIGRCRAKLSSGRQSGSREFLFVRSFWAPNSGALRANLPYLGLCRNRGTRLSKTNDLASASSKILFFNIGLESRRISRNVDGIVLKRVRRTRKKLLLRAAMQG